MHFQLFLGRTFIASEGLSGSRTTDREGEAAESRNLGAEKQSWSHVPVGLKMETGTESPELKSEKGK